MRIKSTVLAGCLVALVVGCLSLVAMGPQDLPDEVKGQVNEFRVAAERLEAEGKIEKAHELRERSEQLIEQTHHRMELRHRLEDLRAEAEKLQAEGKLDRARQVEEEANEVANALEMVGRERRREHGEGNELEQRVHHMHVAAEHLGAAGQGEWAEEILAHAQRMKHEMHAQQQDHERQRMMGHLEELTGAFRHLKKDFDELRETVIRLEGRIDELSNR